MGIKRSIKAFAQASEILVGGVNSPVRTFKGVGGDPLLMSHGKGAKIIDIDRNTYVDYCLSWGSLLLGHAHKDVVKAVRSAAKDGTSFGTTNLAEIELANLICKYVESVQKVRFVNSGTEATMSAIRLARGFTRKDIVVKFDGCYHGHVDDLLTTAGSGVAKLSESSSLGIPQQHVQNTISIPYNNALLLEETLTKHRDRIACVIMEPVAGNMGVVTPKPEFLKVLNELPKKFNIVLIFDEIMTGFRTSLGCVQADLKMKPDLTCFGKIIGGGFPIGAYGGRKDIMDCLAPLGEVYQAGTFSGNPIVMKAGAAVLKNLNQELYKELNDKSARAADELDKFFDHGSSTMHLSSYKSMMSIRFRREKVENYQEATFASSQNLYAKMFQYLLKKGIYLPPADLESFFISTEHTANDLNDLITHIKDFCSIMNN